MKNTIVQFHMYTSIVLIFIASATSCSKGDGKTNTSATEVITNKSTSLLWEISGNGLKQPSYLYGTIHMIAKKDFSIRPLIDSMFTKSDQVAFEFKLDDMSALMKAQKEMNLPEGETLKSMMSDADYEKLKKYLTDSLNTDIEIYNTQKPLALYQVMAQSYIDGETESFELHFLMTCMKLKKPIVGLETIDDQLNVFEKIPYEEQLQWIIEGIDSSAAYENVWNNLVTAYKNEDLEKLSTLMQESSPELEKYNDIFITNRNTNWIPVIEKLIQDKSTFIAVGAGHLPGDTGVIHLLIKQGYTVKPI